MAGGSRQMRRLYEMCALALVRGRADLDGAVDVGFDIDMPLFTVSRAARLAGIHPQTLREYDRQRLVVPQRTPGGARRYSLRDLNRLQQAQQLSQDEGVNLAGVGRILDLQEENRELRRRITRMETPAGSSVFAADADGGIVEIQRSSSARTWRHDIHVRIRELPAPRRAGRPADSKSMVLWNADYEE